MEYVEMIAEEILEVMKLKGYTQKGIAKELNVNVATLSRSLSGDQKLTFELAAQLTRYLDIDIEKALGSSRRKRKFIAMLELDTDQKLYLDKILEKMD